MVVGLSISLVCAVAASLALGVLVAYGICFSMFHLFRIHARQVASRKAVAPIPAATARIFNS
jgi:hypothetical protein